MPARPAPRLRAHPSTPRRPRATAAALGASAIALLLAVSGGALRAQSATPTVPTAAPTAAAPTAAPAPAGAAAAAARPDSTPSPLDDSTGAVTVANARRAQRDYEDRHRRLLKYWLGAPGVCEVKIGTFCYWNNNLDEPAPPERPEVRTQRRKLLGVLARAAAAAPADDWTVGQRVRYLIEDGQADSALAVARACRGSAWWCAALRGHALHAAEQDGPALAAFDTALVGLPAGERCAWDDLTPWLAGRAAAKWKEAPCGTPARAAVARRLWGIAQPLWLSGADDLRAEWYARRVSLALQANAANAYGLPMDGPTTEIELRFGGAASWSLATVPVDPQRGPWNVIGHEPVPSYAFIPDDGRLADVLAGGRVDSLGTNAWSLYAAGVRMRYAPRFARGGLLELDAVRAVQLARFRRGDTSVVAATWSLGRDTTGFEGLARWTSAPLTGALFVKDDALSTVARGDLANAPPRGVLLAREAGGVGAKPRLVGLEFQAPSNRRAARSRVGLATLAADAPISDVLLVAPGVAPDARLETLGKTVYGTTAIRPGASVGLYWEQYGATAPDRPDTVTVSATRLTRTAGERFKSRLGIDVIQRPVRVKVTDRGRPDRHPGRAITINWPEVPPGEYQVDVVVTSADGKEARTGTRVWLEAPK